MKLGKAKANYIDANTMTRQVNLFRATRTSDGQGGYETTFASTYSFWGDLRPDNQVRAIGESELQFDQRSRLYVRYNDNIFDKDELQIDGIRYKIHSIKDVENQKRFMEIIIYK